MAFDTYIAFSKDIKGEATAIKDSIEILSFSWGASSPATVGGGKAGIAASRVSIAFEKIATSYKKQGADNKLSAGGDAAWDLTKLVTK